MNAKLVYDAFHEPAFGYIVVTYFFLAAIAAGSFITSAAVELFGLKENRALARIGALVTPFVMLVVGLIMILELAQPSRFYAVVITLNPTSAMSWGAKILILFAVASVIYAWNALKGAAQPKWLSVAGIALAVLMAVYPPLELVQTKASPLWQSSVLPVLYLVGALLAGTGAVLIASVASASAIATKSGAQTAASSDGNPDLCVGRCLSGLLVFSLVLVAIELITLASGSNEARMIASAILSGKFATLFWGLYVIVGSALPIAILLGAARNRSLQALAAVLILVGIYALRVIEVVGGQSFPLT